MNSAAKVPAEESLFRNMESEKILDLTYSSSERDCNATNHSDCRTIDESTHIDSNGIFVNISAAVENSIGIESEGDVLHANQETKNDELQNDNKVNETSMNECNTQGSVESKKKVDISGKRIAKKFRVLLSNRKVDKIFFGTVDKSIPNKVETWKILYDDGDVDIMSRDDITDAMRYYDINRKYDTNHVHKIPTSPLLHESEEEDEKGGNNKTQPSTAKDRDNRNKKRASPPKRGQKMSAKVARKEPVPVWTGSPDEEIDGGWPNGWVKKVYERKSGATKGSRDRYWYSPKEKFKLRSMVEVKRFFKALAKSKGDEKKAKETMHKY